MIPGTAGGGDPPEEASSPFPRPLRRYVELVNEGAYWESHEVLEGPWRERGSAFYQGLILYASAFVHAERGNLHGIRAQLEKALTRLAGYPDAYLGIDLARLRGHARACRRRVVAGGASLGGAWWEVLGRPRLRLDRTRLRGDEEELRSRRS